GLDGGARRLTLPVHGAPTAVIAPMRARGRTLGALALVATDPGRPFEAADLGVVEDLADRCALAVDNARLYRHEHQVAESLQRSLLPDRLPALAGLEFAARYLPGGPGVEVGGDWYDVIRSPDGELILVIGDVAGRGVRAASTMGQLRTAARAYALEGHSPAAILAGVNRVAHAAELRDMATALCLAYNPATGRLRTANAGHMAPIVISERGEVRSLDGATALPLNVDASVRFVEADAVVDPGSTVLLYTDGLIERRGETLSDSVRELERALEAAPQGAEALCGFIAERARADDGPPDDVALLAFRVQQLRGAALQLRFPAQPEALADVRHSLERWLDQNGATREESAAVVLASGEACANAVEHAYGAADADVEVAATAAGGTVRVSVRDSGRWRPPRGGDRGRGVDMMRALMDDATVAHGDDGTTVELALRLLNPSGAPPAHPSVTTTTTTRARDTIDELIQGDAAVRMARESEVLTATVEGEIDLANSRALLDRVVAALDNRVTGLIVDLSETRFLDSSGLQALLDMRRRTRVRGQHMRVVVPANSPVRRVIEAVGAQQALNLCGELSEARASF
ncbi:MAG TPA: SpoIIE family protein phosphatase, partial [Thermoleophilaceae bacterium]|nr:SpoIIE family protein phosphatase [Thermoleophilaceae bacterium]